MSWGEGLSGAIKTQFLVNQEYLKRHLGADVKVIMFISPRGFKSQKDLIRKEFKKVRVIPMLLGNRFLWLYKYSTLCLILFWRLYFGCFNIITRGVNCSYVFSSANLFRRVGVKLVYDARGAHYPEQVLLNHNADKSRKREIFVVNHIKNVLSISHRLIQYWESDLGIDLRLHQIAVIPCCLSPRILDTSTTFLPDNTFYCLKGFNSNQRPGVRLAYCGSDAPWQFGEGYEFIIERHLHAHVDNSYLHLGPRTDFITRLIACFGDKRVLQKHVESDQVGEYLVNADYGIIVRDLNPINKVASPIKCAEYLFYGLSLIVSAELGDISDLVIEKNLGFVYDHKERHLKSRNGITEVSHLSKCSIASKRKSKEVAKLVFDRITYLNQYKLLFSEDV